MGSTSELTARPFAAVATPARPHATRLADHAVAALIDEVTLSPKPGLVDFRGRGAHRDLSWPLMCHSARTLHPAFAAMAAAGEAEGELQALRERIGAIGRDGEAAMLRATGGINTHRGAIWALGLLVTAVAQMPGRGDAGLVAARAAALARLPDRFAPAATGHKGERACRAYGVGGARAQAQAGFPHVTRAALPTLRASRERGDPEDAARLNALLAVMAELDDTCVLSRGGPTALAAVQDGAAGVLAAGGAGRAAGRRALRALEKHLLALDVSPGGAADLLAATLFLDRVEAQATA
ncbi:triphosphoribosyl-dephospho-CoA synthase [Aromatoleum petrolei]|uniref:Probable 2-(5''-triphosphoribosyl)-3'-dephosphocoenzyme-A synthase n=1 Tax=Aromatoleum petrolei TaxID=76116 RepID=A0ABX1ML69_9RHOO|nr:triphosphoribosyl-dephospho-CoA synthase [Aromatoleum petrolei]NMF87936.1 triphosphoribosyl-dephospho-CoA synthase [Aromatoleum petrolei]QTQ36696.1 putative 2-(5''-triphosphoribosyl)-3'-dephosphocoenzyme-A synthase [Aromatoleum petrolei]